MSSSFGNDPLNSPAFDGSGFREAYLNQMAKPNTYSPTNHFTTSETMSDPENPGLLTSIFDKQKKNNNALISLPLATNQSYSDSHTSTMVMDPTMALPQGLDTANMMQVFPFSQPNIIGQQQQLPTSQSQQHVEQLTNLTSSMESLSKVSQLLQMGLQSVQIGVTSLNSFIQQISFLRFEFSALLEAAAGLKVIHLLALQAWKLISSILSKAGLISSTHVKDTSLAMAWTQAKDVFATQDISVPNGMSGASLQSGAGFMTYHSPKWLQLPSFRVIVVTATLAMFILRWFNKRKHRQQVEKYKIRRAAMLAARQKQKDAETFLAMQNSLQKMQLQGQQGGQQGPTQTKPWSIQRLQPSGSTVKQHTDAVDSSFSQKDDHTEDDLQTQTQTQSEVSHEEETIAEHEQQKVIHPSPSGPRSVQNQGPKSNSNRSATSSSVSHRQLSPQNAMLVSGTGMNGTNRMNNNMMMNNNMLMNNNMMNSNMMNNNMMNSNMMSNNMMNSNMMNMNPMMNPMNNPMGMGNLGNLSSMGMGNMGMGMGNVGSMGMGNMGMNTMGMSGFNNMNMPNLNTSIGPFGGSMFRNQNNMF